MVHRFSLVLWIIVSQVLSDVIGKNPSNGLLTNAIVAFLFWFIFFAWFDGNYVHKSQLVSKDKDKDSE